METIIRNVRDFDTSARKTLEEVIGRPLSANQRLIIQVTNDDTEADAKEDKPPPPLPEWCNVYDGLSDQEIAEIEDIILRRADFSRHSE
jgi:hypothetical protein